MKDTNLSFAAIAGIMKPYYIFTHTQKRRRNGEVPKRNILYLFFISVPLWRSFACVGDDRNIT